METIIGLNHALVVLDCDGPLDRMSTHPRENLFGVLRRLLNDCNKFDELLHATAQNAVVTEIYHPLHHPRDVCGRDNEGEIVSRTDGDSIETPVLTVQQAFQPIWSVLQLSDPSEMEFPARAIEEMESLLSWLESLQQISKTKHLERDALFTIRAAANSKIMASLLQRRGE
jgi:hypothetical protein